MYILLEIDIEQYVFFEIDGERFEIVEDGDIRNIGETVPIQYSTNNPNINEIIHNDD